MTQWVRTMLLLAVAVVLVSDSPASAGDLRPWKGRVTAKWDNVFNALFDPPATFVGGGQVSHMGKTQQTGTLTLMPTSNPAVFNGSGMVTITAANGDVLMFKYNGSLNAVTGRGVGALVFTGGTGRFADASGTGTFEAQIDTSLPDNQPMTVKLKGKLSY